MCSVQVGQTCIEIRLVHQTHLAVTVAELLGKVVHALTILTALAFFKADQVLLHGNVIHAAPFSLLGFQVGGSNFGDVWPVHTLMVYTKPQMNWD